MRKLVAILFLAAFVACGGDSITDATASIAGTYTLRSVNGSPLPFTVFTSGTQKIEITDDMVVISESGTYSESGHTRTTNGTQVTTQTVAEAGTYTRNGTAITFRSSDKSLLSMATLSVSPGAYSNGVFVKIAADAITCHRLS